MHYFQVENTVLKIPTNIIKSYSDHFLQLSPRIILYYLILHSLKVKVDIKVKNIQSQNSYYN